MFKKPLGGIKTSAPLRSSDRRKLKQRVLTAFAISPEDGDLLVPEGILSIKFSTHLDEPGIAYLSPDGDPLWFTIGKQSDDLIPTVYTLWKQRNLLPFLSTPPAVIPVLVGGADLMIPGVIHHTPSLREGQLVSISQYNHRDEKPTLSPPLAVGRMALPSDQLQDGGKEKGKAVHILHTWKDHLWDMGSKLDMPEGTAVEGTLDNEDTKEEKTSEHHTDSPPPETSVASTVAPAESILPTISYTPQEITDLLHISLLQAISTSLSSLPSSSFPITSTTFYTNYILPARPAFPTSILSPSQSHSSSDDDAVDISPQDITIKTSTHKSLTTFLKSAEKATLLTLKAPPKHSQQSDLLITSVNATHPSVAGHKSHPTVKDLEAKAAKKAQKEEKEREAQVGKSDLEVVEMWKPHQGSIALFEGLKERVTAVYTLSEIKSLLNAYILANSLVNVREQAYINLDPLLLSCVSSKTKGKAKGKDAEVEPSGIGLEFMKRDELIKKIVERMQSWYEIRVEGKDTIRKKGSLKPIQVVTKIRQGRKASTLITGFEPFAAVDADEMAEDLRKTCAGATSVSPVAGKPANSGLEVLVQGKQSKAVVEYLTGKGIPKKWIEVVDISGKK